MCAGYDFNNCEKIGRARAVRGFGAIAVATTAAGVLCAGCIERPTYIKKLPAPGAFVVRPNYDGREPCAARNALKNLYWGDLHVHTKYSFDAAAYEVRSGPDDAYRFAKGFKVGLPPYDRDGNPRAEVALDRPLDFAAVTDHAELIDATSICTDSQSSGYTSETCTSYRESFGLTNNTYTAFLSAIGLAEPSKPTICQEDPDLCAASLDAAWRDIRAAAEAHYDRSAACKFTSFLGWEWTGTAGFGGRNIHRNIIFRNATTLRHPISYVDIQAPEALWDALDAQCIDGDPLCDALVIPHNANIGVGQMFRDSALDGTPHNDAQRAQRRRLERLFEIYQHKGASECVSAIDHPLASEDELCDFELLFGKPCAPGQTPENDGCTPLCNGNEISGFLQPCYPVQDYARGALRRGLVTQLARGINPFEFGFVGATDTHAATPGAVSEKNWQGHVGINDDTPSDRLRAPGGISVSIRTSSPGGLTAVWAEENSRESLFDALKRRETYATSGSRPLLRFFGGFSLPDNVCEDASFLERASELGVPMGGTIKPPQISGARPTFAIFAQRDPQSAPLERIDIIKGSASDGQSREEVIAIVDLTAQRPALDLDSCELNDAPQPSLCETFTDNDYDPQAANFYYARIVEAPTCRWSHYICLAEQIDCTQAGDGSDLFKACCQADLPKTTQERAWSSPIFIYPSDSE